MDSMERERQENGTGKENEQKGTGMRWGHGQLGRTRGELVDFIYWFLTFSF